METVKVKIADLAVKQGDGILVTIGLGSCVGIALHDGQPLVAGLAHVLLSDSAQFVKKNPEKYNPAKFADTALPLLVEKMEKMGARRSRIEAKIAGGSKLFGNNSNVMGIGERNVEMVRKTLKELNIPLKAEDVGGNYGRTMKLDVPSGEVIISTAGRGEKKL